MNKTKITQIKSIEKVKSGVTNNKSWDKYQLTDIEDWKFTTFQEEPAKTHMVRQDQVEISYEETDAINKNPKTGFPYKNKTIRGIRAVGQEKPATGQISPINSDIGNILTKMVVRLDGLEKMTREIKQILEMPALDMEPPEENTDPF